MIKILLSLILSVNAVGATPYKQHVFEEECQKRLAPGVDPILATIEEFRDKPVDLENVVGWIGAILGDEQDIFKYEINEQLEEEAKGGIVRRKPGIFSTTPKNSIEFFTRRSPIDETKVLKLFFNAIRAVFTAQLGDALQYHASSQGEKMAFYGGFGYRAAHVLFLQYLIYRKLLDLAGLEGQDREVKDGPLSLFREFRHRLAPKRPFRLFGPKGEDDLFNKVELQLTLFRRLDTMPLVTREDRANMEEKINEFVERNYVARLDGAFASKPGLLRKGSWSIAILIGVGALGAGFGWVASHGHFFTNTSFESLQRKVNAQSTDARSIDPEVTAKDDAADAATRELSEIIKRQISKIPPRAAPPTPAPNSP